MVFRKNATQRLYHTWGPGRDLDFGSPNSSVSHFKPGLTQRTCKSFRQMLQGHQRALKSLDLQPASWHKPRPPRAPGLGRLEILVGGGVNHGPVIFMEFNYEASILILQHGGFPGSQHQRRDPPHDTNGREQKRAHPSPRFGLPNLF